jgi:hypothetical protein
LNAKHPTFGPNVAMHVDAASRSEPQDTYLPFWAIQRVEDRSEAGQLLDIQRAAKGREIPRRPLGFRSPFLLCSRIARQPCDNPATPRISAGAQVQRIGKMSVKLSHVFTVVPSSIPNPLLYYVARSASSRQQISLTTISKCSWSGKCNMAAECPAVQESRPQQCRGRCRSAGSP